MHRNTPKIKTSAKILADVFLLIALGCGYALGIFAELIAAGLAVANEPNGKKQNAKHRNSGSDKQPTSLADVMQSSDVYRDGRYKHHKREEIIKRRKNVYKSAYSA